MIKINDETKDAIVTEYIAGGTSLRKLSVKYGVNYKTIHHWIEEYRGKTRRKQQSEPKAEAMPLPAEVEQLQAELRRTKLHNEVLQEMLKLSEDLTGIELKKKFGTRQF